MTILNAFDVIYSISSADSACMGQSYKTWIATSPCRSSVVSVVTDKGADKYAVKEKRSVGMPEEKVLALLMQKALNI